MTPDDVVKYVAGRNRLAHAMYVYECDTCGNPEFIYLGVGVEGPDKEQSAWIASPFMGPTCLKCGCEETTHVEWFLDQHFPEPIRPPIRARMFAVPEKGPDPDTFHSSVFSGEIVICE